jgi:AraC-like DNA-binding protein
MAAARGDGGSPEARLRNGDGVASVVEAMSVSVAEERRGLAKTVLADTTEFAIESVECQCGPGEWSPPEPATRYGIVFVRQGCFHRRLNGRESFVDPTVVYFERPDDEQQIAHPGGGDSCTALYLAETLLSSVWGGEPGLPDEPLATEPATDLQHRLLFALTTSGDDGAVADAVVATAAAVLARAAPRRVAAGRPATALARRRVVAEARELLVENPAATVLELARHVAVSPHHLSRVFRAETGETVSRYRNRLRVRLALERIAKGEACLARLAADLGFADQAHLSRVVGSELGMPPSALRRRLRA